MSYPLFWSKVLPLLESDTALLLDVAQEAGEIAKGYFRSNPKIWDKGDNAGPVTEADLAVNEMFFRRLQSARPDYGWLSEETEDNVERLNTKRQFILDPIDGTRAFISGSKNWAHSLAIVEDGSPIAAVVLMPVAGKTYHASKGTGAFLNGDPIQVSKVNAVEQADVLTAKANLKPELWHHGQRPDFKVSFRSSLAYRMSLAAQGRFDAMISLHPTWEWDIAAGSLIVTEAGGIVCDKFGKDLCFNNENPQLSGVIAGGAIVPTLRNALSSLVSEGNST